MNTFISWCYTDRKTLKIDTPHMKGAKVVSMEDIMPRDCSYLGCINELTEDNVIQKAKIGKRLLGFCSQYCYEEWLRCPRS